MTGNLVRRLQHLESTRKDREQVYVFRRGPEDDAALDLARQDAGRTGKRLIIVSWLDAQP